MIDESTPYVRELPFRGELRELVVLGNGKDSTLRARVPDGHAFAMTLSRACTTIKPCAGIVVSTRGEGDSSLSVRYQPMPGWRMRVARFEVNYPGSNEDWAADSALWQRMSTARWPPEGRCAVDAVTVELGAWTEEATVQSSPLPGAAHR